MYKIVGGVQCNGTLVMMSYRHTQSGKTILMFLGVALAGALVALMMSGGVATWILVPVIGLLVVVGWLFSSLTVSIEGEAVSWWFGPGFWRKRIAVDQIQSFARVENRWWWGWGIRYYGKGWLYNVAGLDAVELFLKNDKHVRIGTDEPDALVEALNQAFGR